MSFDANRLYDLLPAVYRIRDQEQGGALLALLGVLAEQAAVLEEDIQQLHDDLFIETCVEWVVPYLGELIGTHGIHEKTAKTASQRAQVANTLAYRRRKGTLAVLELLARDVTNWNAVAVEFYQRLAITQHMNHVRPDAMVTADLRDELALEFVDTAFDRHAHLVDVRNIASGRGRYNIPNIGLFLWRLREFPINHALAVKVDDRRYMFSSLGNDVQLFTLPASEASITTLAEPIHVRMPISRRLLHYRRDDLYGPDKSLSLIVDGTPVPPDQVHACDLSDMPDSSWAHSPADAYGIDPVLGRIATPLNQPAPTDVRVRYHYGFSTSMGGGEYDRATAITELAAQDVSAAQPQLATALSLIAGGGVAEIKDSGTYVWPGSPALTIDADGDIELRAADACRPTIVLADTLEIQGEANTSLTLNGLLIVGAGLRISGQLDLLRLEHCTLVPGLALQRNDDPVAPGLPSLIVESPGTRVIIEDCIVGGLRVAQDASLTLTNSIVDANAETALAYAAPDGAPGGAVTIENCTLRGKVVTMVMNEVSNTIFLASRAASDTRPPVLAERRQQGCVRFSYVPRDAQVPRPYRCQPGPESNPLDVRPMFTSLSYGDAGYFQLSQYCAAEIRQGADDESEMGAFHDLYQPQLEANLRIRLDEYLRFGLEAGIFYAS